MSSGHASHKGTGIKHSHDTGQIDSAATTPASDPQDLLNDPEGYPFNAQDTKPSPLVTDRPDESADEDLPKSCEPKSCEMSADSPDQNSNA